MPALNYFADTDIVDLLKSDAARIRKEAPRRPPASNAPRPNIRFLRNLVRDTDSHNSALLAKERQEARARQEKLQRQYDGRLSPRADRDASRHSQTEATAKRSERRSASERHNNGDRGTKSDKNTSKDKESTKERRRSRNRDADPNSKDRSRKRHRSDSAETTSTAKPSKRRRSKSPEEMGARNSRDDVRQRHGRDKRAPDNDNEEDAKRRQRLDTKASKLAQPASSPARKHRGYAYDEVDEEERFHSQKQGEKDVENRDQARRRRRLEKKALGLAQRRSSASGKDRNDAGDEVNKESIELELQRDKSTERKRFKSDEKALRHKSTESKSKKSESSRCTDRHRSTHNETLEDDSSRNSSQERSHRKIEPIHKEPEPLSKTTSSTKQNHSKKTRTKEFVSSSKKLRRPRQDSPDPLEEIVGPLAPDESPNIRTRGRGKFSTDGASMDERFNAKYDPTVDMQPESADEDDWDQALEVMRDRQKWQQAGADRLRSAGFSEEQISKWQKKGKDDEGDVDDVRWKHRGQGREWDRGKVVKLDADDDKSFDVEIKADWNLGRLTGS